MCNRFVSPSAAAIERQWHLGARQPWDRSAVFPRLPGAFLRPGAASGEVDLVVGLFGLVPSFAKEAPVRFATQNCRSEDMRSTASFRQPWARGQRCLIPAESFDEPGWETGRNVWHAFSRRDGGLWALAGLWNAWVHPGTGEVVESFTMLTRNADGHAVMGRMHKPDPKLPPDAQDKRSVVAIEPADVARWLWGSPADALSLLQLTPAEEFVVTPPLAETLF